MTTRPVRERSVDDVGRLMERTLDATGYEEVSLVSLSTCDHSRVRQLVAKSVEVAAPRRVSIGLPSLRLDSFSVELADMVADTRRTGLTFAPEAASPRLRALINKWIPDDDLLEMSAEAYERGWDHVKLYFMIGLPTERDDDIEAIADLCRRVVDRGRRINRRASVRTGVSTFVPKPLTPFQWAAQIDMGETERRQRLLMDRLRSTPQVKFGRHHPEETFLEGLVSRADRRAADLIEAAFRAGARFDAWSEHLDMRAWSQAIAETGYDTAGALRERGRDERLPWDHIDIHVPKQWFVEDWERAMVLEHAADCRHSKCHRCGVIDVKRPLCASMLRNAIAGAKEEKSWTRPPLPPMPANVPVQRLRFRVTRTGVARHLSHLEVAKVWQRALRRAHAPMLYAHDFHPLPRVNFSSALPVGEDSLGEYMDVVLLERREPLPLLAALSATLPEGFAAVGVVEVPIHAPGLMGEVGAWDYRVVAPGDDRTQAQWAGAVESLREKAVVLVEREGKKGRIQVDIRPMLRRLEGEVGEGAMTLEVGLQAVDGRPGKIKEVLGLLGIDPLAVRILRLDSLVRDGNGWKSPGEGMLTG
jgi:radical SAM-linked protein